LDAQLSWPLDDQLFGQLYWQLYDQLRTKIT